MLLSQFHLGALVNNKAHLALRAARQTRLGVESSPVRTRKRNVGRVFVSYVFVCRF